ncbi:hypothetical protein [Streptomyces sp. NPDC047315]|uniref:hypothetical protein n=1 Tax=Streptomyces sp. NPDC047315 TaxID=3155142 RepID=UPI0033D12017
MTDVQLEAIELDGGIPLMYRDFGHRVRMAYDPQQIGRAEALALLCARVPRLIGTMRLCEPEP